MIINFIEGNKGKKNKHTSRKTNHKNIHQYRGDSEESCIKKCEAKKKFHVFIPLKVPVCECMKNKTKAEAKFCSYPERRPGFTCAISPKKPHTCKCEKTRRHRRH